MDKIKKTFLKILFIVLISDGLSTLLYWAADFFPFGQLVFQVLTAPFYIGLYRYCFNVIDGGEPMYKELLSFYSGADRCVKSAAAYLLGDLFVSAVLWLIAGILMVLIFSGLGGDESAWKVLCLICFLVFGALGSVFLFTPFIYAAEPEKGLKYAAKGSLYFFVKYVLAMAVFALVQTFLPSFCFNDFGRYVIKAFFRLAKIYLAYFIIEKNGGITSEKSEEDYYGEN